MFLCVRVQKAEQSVLTLNKHSSQVEILNLDVWLTSNSMAVLQDPGTESLVVDTIPLPVLEVETVNSFFTLLV